MAVTDEKELQQLRKRLIELADTAYSQNRYTYTPFLGLAEQQAYYAVEREVAYAGVRMEGGSPLSERRMIRFGEPGYEEDYPIAALRLIPKAPKYAENLTHRDFLGAVMSLGIERDVVGDLFVDAEKERGALLFCHEAIAGYIMENLHQVRHTNIICRREEKELTVQNAEPERVSLTAASVRADGVIAKLYHLSRSDSQELFRTGRIFINGISTENEGRQLKEGDFVTVRGFGKFIFYGKSGMSKKGKERLEVGVYGSV